MGDLTGSALIGRRIGIAPLGPGVGLSVLDLEALFYRESNQGTIAN